MRVLLTGMSGTGKSALVQELRRRGHAAHDADEELLRAAGPTARWGWQADDVAELLEKTAGRAAVLPRRLLGGAGGPAVRLPRAADRPAARDRAAAADADGNAAGREDRELAQVLADLDEVEPLLRRSADLVLATTVPPPRVADGLLQAIAAPP